MSSKKSTAPSSPSGLDQDKAYDDSVPFAVQAQESKRRKRRIMKIAVYFMFGIISIGVFAIWLFHKDTIESLRFGSSFVFTVKLRSLEVKNEDGDGILYGELGRFLLATPYDHCREKGTNREEENCILWRDVARLRVERDDNSTSSCYTLTWEGLEEGYPAEDCFYLEYYKWYGYLTNTTPPWPIMDEHIPEGVDYYTEYPTEQTESLVPVWFGSQGVAIFVDSGYPFTFGWNVTDKRQFCITSKLSATETGVARTLLRYTICHSESIKEVYSVSQKHRIDMDTDFAFKQKHQHLLLHRPIHALTGRDDLPKLLRQLMQNESQCSLLELYDHWEDEWGDLSVDNTEKEGLRNLIKEAARHDCHPIIPISTFFSYKSKYFQEGVTKGYFVKDRQNLVTRMIRWRGNEGAALDVTNPEAEDWFLSHVKRLIQELKAKALKLLNLSIPSDSKYYDYNMTHLDYTRIFYRDLAALNISLVLELATGFIPMPVYTPIRMQFHGEPGSSCLNTSIPYSLTLGLSGYPLLIADADRMALPSTTHEMFLRWLQLAIFFPVLEIPNIPVLDNKQIQDNLRTALELRNGYLLPYMSTVWEEEPDLPIIRPLWWLAPDDERASTINDQFMVGNKLLVAPVLCEGSETRSVYLPEGSWIFEGKLISMPKSEDRSFDTRNASVILYFWESDFYLTNIKKKQQN